MCNMANFIYNLRRPFRAAQFTVPSSFGTAGDTHRILGGAGQAQMTGAPPSGGGAFGGQDDQGRYAWNTGSGVEDDFRAMRFASLRFPTGTTIYNPTADDWTLNGWYTLMRDVVFRYFNNEAEWRHDVPTHEDGTGPPVTTWDLTALQAQWYTEPAITRAEIGGFCIANEPPNHTPEYFVDGNDYVDNYVKPAINAAANSAIPASKWWVQGGKEEWIQGTRTYVGDENINQALRLKHTAYAAAIQTAVQAGDFEANIETSHKIFAGELDNDRLQYYTDHLSDYADRYIGGACADFRLFYKAFKISDQNVEDLQTLLIYAEMVCIMARLRTQQGGRVDGVQWFQAWGQNGGNFFNLIDGVWSKGVCGRFFELIQDIYADYQHGVMTIDNRPSKFYAEYYKSGGTVKIVYCNKGDKPVKPAKPGTIFSGSLTYIGSSLTETTETFRVFPAQSAGVLTVTQ